MWVLEISFNSFTYVIHYYIKVNIHNFSCVYQGGGTGGSIRDAGGSFGKMEAAHEDQYFRKLVSKPKKNQLFFGGGVMLH